MCPELDCGVEAEMADLIPEFQQIVHSLGGLLRFIKRRAGAGEVAQQLEHWLLIKGPRLGFLTPTWWLTMRNSVCRGSSAFSPLWVPGMYVALRHNHRQNTHAHKLFFKKIYLRK